MPRTTKPSELTAPAPLGVVLTIGEAAEYLKISHSTAYKLAQEGKIPGQKVGKHRRFRKDTIDRWLDENREGRR
jgi:excisionase family DNA binding protein